MKKLFISIFTAVFALFALGTSTFAWFSMNDVVTAKDMSVTIKSDASFLLIKAGAATALEVQQDKKVSADALNKTAALLPVAHNLNLETAKLADANTASNWYYKTSDDPALYGGAGHESEAVALETLSGYVLENTFTLTVAAGANNMENIKVGSCTITTANGADKAVKVLVATSTAAEEFGPDSGTGSKTLQAALSSSTTMEVKVFIYWDGTDADVYTNGIADLQNTSVVITFVGTTVVA